MADQYPERATPELVVLDKKTAPSATLDLVPPIGFARALADAERFKHDNVTDTYRGQILIGDGEKTVSAILKDLPVRELANELLGAAVAVALGIPSPVAYLTVAPKEAFTASHAPESPEGEKLVFASTEKSVPSLRFQYLGATPEMQRELFESIAAWPLVGQAFALDSWLANVDRNLGNLLFGGPGDIWLIDHGQILTGPAWTIAGLDPAGQYVDKLRLWLTPVMTTTQISNAVKEVGKFEKSLSEPRIEAILTASHIASLLPADDVAAVRKFLTERSPLVSYYASKALGEARLI